LGVFKNLPANPGSKPITSQANADDWIVSDRGTRR
jgi:hypothetical protein